MPTRDIITIGASAGGVETLRELIALLPGDLPAAVCIVQHMAAERQSQLPDILAARAQLPAAFAQDGEEVRPGRVYVAPPNNHLLVEPGRLRVIRGPRENRHRPAIDPLFRSAAWAYGPRVVGVVLTGFLDDGTAGLWAIKSCGGTTIVQSSADALYPDMPRNAAIATEVDHTLAVAEIAPLLDRLAREPVAAATRNGSVDRIETEIEFAKFDRDINAMDRIGTLSAFTCPACRGALWELEDGETLRYRCHTGHAFTSDSFLEQQSTSIEEALYASLRAVEEKASILRRLQERHAGRSASLAKDFEGKARSLDQTAEILRSMLAGAEI
jgi:two-component system chemotaxis response regulator CheB